MNRSFFQNVYQRALTLIVVTISVQFLIIYNSSADWFEEVTNQAGTAYTGPSFGAAWGDVNSDGWPDFWTSNHAYRPRLYINNRNGSFIDGTDSIPYRNADMHGSAWSDFDNDGDQDLLLMVGAVSGTGEGQNQFYVNTPDGFIESAALYGLDYTFARARNPLWFDWNNDGLLDVIISSPRRNDGQGNTALFTQSHDDNTFTNSFPNTGFSTSAEFIMYSQLMTIGEDQLPAIIIHSSSYPDSIIDYSNVPFVDLKSSLGLVSSISRTNDTALGDFNGDLLQDIIFARSIYNITQADLLNPTTVASLIIVQEDEKGFVINTNGTLTITVGPGHELNLDHVYIGEQATNPMRHTFNLSPQDPANIGIPDHLPGVDSGVFIGYEPERNEWHFLVSSPRAFRRSIRVISQETIESFTTVGFTGSSAEMPISLLVQNAQGFSLSEAHTPAPCGNIATADFDNDMDLDVYLVCRGSALNEPNILLENIGDGEFTAVPNAGGAQGSTRGRGDSVSLADFDRDGFIDFVLTNGVDYSPFNNGPMQLFRNIGNSNHWLQLDLEGVVSNRDGIGTKIIARTQNVQQYRFQDGGMHRSSQNHNRIHFGLGQYNIIDELTVKWPSGITQTVHNLPADQIVHLIEPSSPSLFGQPTYTDTEDRGVYLWKTSFDGPYHLSIKGNGVNERYDLQLLADEAILDVTEHDLEQNDILQWNNNYLTLDSSVSIGTDSLDFKITPGSNAYISVSRDGAPNPRQLHIGVSEAPITPAGWILSLNDFPELPTNQNINELGLLIGRLGNELRTRWSGDGQLHTTELEMIFSEHPTSVNTVSFETNDNVSTQELSLNASSYVSTGWDGLNVELTPNSHVVMNYVQDGLIQTNRINETIRSLGPPNAYQLPIADPYGRPEYNSADDANLFIWKDESTDTWHVRGTAGGRHAKYVGKLYTDGNFYDVTPIQLEQTDRIEVLSSNLIVFSIDMVNVWQDGFSFKLPEDATLSIKLYNNSVSYVENIRITGNANEKLRIGRNKWSVDSLPLDLSGW
jgi:hypothetical protein